VNCVVPVSAGNPLAYNLAQCARLITFGTEEDLRGNTAKFVE